MKLVRDRVEAAWLPARFRYALFQSIAFVRYRTMRPQARPGLAVAVERDQSVFESYTMAVWMMVNGVSFLYVPLHKIMPAALAALAAAFTASVVLQIIVCATALVPALRGRDNVRLNSGITLLLLAAGATASLLTPSPAWVRAVAWSFFAAIAMNVAAWILLLFVGRDALEVEVPAQP